MPEQPQAKASRWAQTLKDFFVGKEDMPDNLGGHLDQIDPMDVEPASIATLLGNDGKARSRQEIYAKWQIMLQDPIISTALRLHVTAALGGDESKGEVIFIECTPEAAKNESLKQIVDDINNDLKALLNLNAFTLAFYAVGFGDGYARVYSQDQVGVTGLICDEMVLPPLVQPFEQGSNTVGYVVGTAKEANGVKLSPLQMVRVKMPRTLYTSQARVLLKAYKSTLREDDINNLPYLPAMVGGSFLEGVEEPYDRLKMALSGLVGQRIQDGIDEALLTVNMSDMTLEQQKSVMTNITRMLTESAAQTAKAVKEGRSLLGKMRQLIPIWSDKQLVQVEGGTGTARSGSITIDDVMFHAKQVAGALGIDLAMLGFADLLAGGLGDGGFFRMSAQVAERSRMIRVALTQAINDIIDIHLYRKHRLAFNERNRPWQVNFYSGISSLEKERADTRMAAMNTGGILVQTLSQLKELGLDEGTLTYLLTVEMKLDESLARRIAKSLVSQAAAPMQEAA